MSRTNSYKIPKDKKTPPSEKKRYNRHSKEMQNYDYSRLKMKNYV